MANPKIQELRNLAERLVTRGENRETFMKLLAGCDEVGPLLELASEYTPHDEVSVPIYQRLRELLPMDAQIAAELGFVFWLSGQDEKAAEQAARAGALDPKNVQGLLLRAALSQDEERKRSLYREVLTIDPQNEVARANLRSTVHSSWRRA